MKIKFGAVSDTHTRDYHVPEVDVIIHAGDLTFQGRTEEVANAFYDLKKQKAKHRIIIAGNHDWLAQKDPTVWKNLCEDFGITYLQDSGVVIDSECNIHPLNPHDPIDGIKIWGSPWQPEFYNWAFNLPRGNELKRIWDMIPEETDILVTHGPPSKILDEVREEFVGGWGQGDAGVGPVEHVGCWDLRQAVERIKPKFHIFGHIHMAYGERKVGKTTFLNASLCSEQYRVVNKPHIFEVSKKETK